MINYESLVKVLKSGGYRKSNEVHEDNGMAFVDFTSNKNHRVIYTAVLNPKYPGTAERVLKTDVVTTTPTPTIINGLAELKKQLGL